MDPLDLFCMLSEGWYCVKLIVYIKLTSKGRVVSRRLRQIFCQRVVLEGVFIFLQLKH